MPTILLKKSDTPGSVPGTANLTNLAGGVEVAVNTADKRVYSMTSASAVIELGTNPSSLTCSDVSATVLRAGSATITNLLATTLTVSGGTANGLLYLNGSKVATSGSALVFDGTNLGIGTASPVARLDVFKTSSDTISRTNAVGAFGDYVSLGAGLLLQQTLSSPYGFALQAANAANSVQFPLLLNPSGGNVGIGTSSPAQKLDVQGSATDFVAFNGLNTNNNAGTITSSAIKFGFTSTVGTHYATLKITEDSANSNSGGLTISLPNGGVETPVLALTSAGNLLLGGTSTTQLDGVFGQLIGSSSKTSAGIALETSAGAYMMYTDSTDSLIFWDSGDNAARATISNTGNLGLGVTPSLWNSDYKALNIGSKGIVYGRVGSQETAIGANWYRTTAAAFVYASNGFATFYAQDSGNHTWHIAPNNTSGAGATASFTQAMTLNASGNLGVGTTSPADSANFGRALDIQSSTGAAAYFRDSDDTTKFAVAGFFGSDSNAYYGSYGTGTGTLFFTSGSERGRFTAGGFFKASNTGTYANSTNDRYEFSSDKDDINIIVRTTSTGASVVNLYSQFPAGPTAGAYHFAGAIAGSGYQFTVDADGDVKNTNGSYAAISDLKLKQDIEDAASQWDDIKSVRVRKYRFKRTPDAPLQIGVIAQELEQTSPGLVSEDADRDEENNELGTTTKSVKYSILYMKAVKALQEAMARIESLEAKVAALEAK